MKRLADGRDCIKHIAQLVHVGHFEPGYGGFVPHHMGKLRAFTQRKRQAQAHRVRDRQDVAEQDCRIKRIALQRLQRHLGGVVSVGGQAHEAARLGARGFVLGQVAARLAHQPDRGVRRGLAQAGAQKGVVLKGCKHGGIVSGLPGAPNRRRGGAGFQRIKPGVEPHRWTTAPGGQFSGNGLAPPAGQRLRPGRRLQRG